MRCGPLMGPEVLYDLGVEAPEARVVAVVCARSAPAEPTGADRGPGRRGYRTHDSGGCRGGARVSLDGRLGAVQPRRDGGGSVARALPVSRAGDRSPERGALRAALWHGRSPPPERSPEPCGFPSPHTERIRAGLWRPGLD